MEERKSKKGTGYFSELALRFNQEQIEYAVPKDDRLPVLLDGQEIGVVTPGGSMRIRKECMDEPDADDLYHRVGEIAAEVREYRNLLEDAPPLKTSSLDAPYKLLADFNGYVLGGMESKRDFAIRAGLVPEEKQFTPEQLIEIHHCCAD